MPQQHQPIQRSSVLTGVRIKIYIIPQKILYFYIYCVFFFFFIFTFVAWYAWNVYRVIFIMIWTEKKKTKKLTITGDLPVRIWIWKKTATVVIIVVFGIVATAFFAQDPASEKKKKRKTIRRRRRRRIDNITQRWLRISI